MPYNSKKRKIKDIDVNQLLGTDLSKQNYTEQELLDSGVISSISDEKEFLNQLEKEKQVSKSTEQKALTKTKKIGLAEYQQIFLTVPKITDRKTVFISNDLREQIVSIVRKLGIEKSSVSGFIENLVRHHLQEYNQAVEDWKRQ